MENENKESRQHIIALTKNPRMNEFTSERIVERLTEKDLIKVQKIMKKQTSLNITSFLRIFRNILSPSPDDDFYLTYGLFRLFQEACLEYRKFQINFNDFSTIITQKIPTSNQEIRLSEKLYPLNIEIPENIKKKIFAPQVIGKVLEERERLQEKPNISDKFLHLNRRVAQSIYSSLNEEFITIDYPSVQIKFLNKKFQYLRSVQTELEISKRDAIVTWIAWSEHEQRLAVLLGNNSISLWAKEDDYRYEVNVPLSLSKLAHPYVMLGYMESSKIWWALDERPTVYILSPYNFQPEYQFTHFKMIKEKPTQKFYTVELKYRKLLCIAFERNVFVLSLDKRELITQLRNFKTSITSIAFSQTYQALFISNFDTTFTSYELSQHQDLTEKGAFQGHKGLVTLLGVLQGSPVVFSVDQRAVIKLWDIRDFSCYQTFQILKNVDFHQVIQLQQSLCFVGSKHVCYRWQRFSEYKEKQKIIFITQLQKDILMVTSKEMRLYNHSNGVLMKVLKGVFGNMHIVNAYLIQIRKMLLLTNEQGQLKIYSTKDFTLITTLNILPKPHSLSYDKQTQLLTVLCMGEIRICMFKELSDFSMKRRIFNKKQLIKICKISTVHDVIAVQYDGPHLFLYSYERAKPLGFLILEDLVKIDFLPNKNVILLLCKDKLMILSFKKYLSSISFFNKKVIFLWEPSQLSSQSIRTFSGSIASTDFTIFDNEIIVSSSNASIQCKLQFNFSLIQENLTQIQKDNYNPYRVNFENHLESFEMSKPSLIIDETINVLLSSQQYVQQSIEPHAFQLLSTVNQFYCITNELQTIFYDLQCIKRGVISYKQTLPVVWDLHNYTQQQFSQFDFVLDFIRQEKPAKVQSEIFGVTAPEITISEEIITLNMLSPTKSKISLRSNSLRQKKMILQKERDDKEKYENFLEIRKGEELLKLKQINRSSNQKYVSESLAFFNVNRNKLLLSKGLPETELPQIRTLEAKLNAVMKRDEKKSMVSKYSHPFQNTSPQKKQQQVIIEEPTPKVKQLKFLQNESGKESIKEHLQRLDLTLRHSKFHHKSRSSSLPFLKVQSQNT